MLQYDGDSIIQNSTLTNFKELGEVTIERTKSQPFFALRYKNWLISKKNETMCAETNGDCRKLLDNYLTYEWSQLVYNNLTSKTETIYRAVDCTEEQVGKE
jgi:hypothetical protein